MTFPAQPRPLADLPPLNDEETALITSREKIAAIKAYRARTNCMLHEAKNVVEGCDSPTTGYVSEHLLRIVATQLANATNIQLDTLIIISSRKSTSQSDLFRQVSICRKLLEQTLGCYAYVDWQRQGHWQHQGLTTFTKHVLDTQLLNDSSALTTPGFIRLLLGCLKSYNTML